MAKQTEQKASTPTAPPPAAAPANGAAPAQTDAESSAIVMTAQSLGKDALQALINAQKDDSVFEKPEGDFWKPEKPGDTLIGTYLGSAKEGRLTQHGFAVLGKDGKARTVRCNGSHIVTRTLADCRVGRLVKLVFKGQEKTGTDGRRINQFDVFLGKE